MVGLFNSIWFLSSKENIWVKKAKQQEMPKGTETPSFSSVYVYVCLLLAWMDHIDVGVVEEARKGSGTPGVDL